MPGHDDTRCGGRSLLLLLLVAPAAPSAWAHECGGGARTTARPATELWFRTGGRRAGSSVTASAGCALDRNRPSCWRISRTAASASGCRRRAGWPRRWHLGVRFRLPRPWFLEGPADVRPAGRRTWPRRCRRLEGWERGRVVVIGASLGGIAAVVAGAAIRPQRRRHRRRLSAGHNRGPAERPALGVAAARAGALHRSGAGPERPLRLRGRRAAPLRGDGLVGERLELVPGAQHGVSLADASAAVRSLLERFIRDPRATVRT